MDRKAVKWCVDVILASVGMATAPTIGSAKKLADALFAGDGPFAKDADVQIVLQHAVLEAFGAGLSAIGAKDVFADTSVAQTHPQKLAGRLGRWTTDHDSLKSTLDATVRTALESLPKDGGGIHFHYVTQAPLYVALFEGVFDLKAGDAKLRPGERFTFDRAAHARFQHSLRTSGELVKAVGTLRESAALAGLGCLLDLQRTFPERHAFGNIPVSEVDPERDGIPPLPLGDVYVPPSLEWLNGKEPRPSIREELAPLLDRPQACLQRAVNTAPITVVEQGFGNGKSLTARTLAAEMLDAFDHGDSPYMPVFVTCKFGSGSGDASECLDRVLQQGVRNTLDIAGVAAVEWNPADAPPPCSVVWIIDGLDELGAKPEELEALFRDIEDRAGSSKRFVVFSRPSALSALDRVFPNPRATIRLVRLAIRGFDIGRRLEWVEQWNKACEAEQLPPIDVDALNQMVQDDLYATPILMFMAAVASRTLPPNAPLASVYEHFAAHVAVGKWRQSPEEHTSLVDKLEAALDALRLPELLPPPEGFQPKEQRVIRGFLHVLSKVAYEAMAAPNPEDSDVVLDDRVRSALVSFRLSDDELNAIVDCVMLAAHGRADGKTHSFLFAHASFREFLATRYFLERVFAAAQSGGRLAGANADVTLDLGRIDLLDRSEAARTFVLDAGQWWSRTPSGKAKKLRDWLSEELSNTTQVFAMATSDPNESDRGTRVLPVAFAIERGVEDTATHLVVCAPDERSDLRGAVLYGLAALPSCWERDTWSGSALPTMIRRGPVRGRARGAWVSPRANLFQANLFQANLGGANLFEANLVGANLVGANLFEANLVEANLVEANLVGANLVGANLVRANLERADLVGANLFEANLVGANLGGANLFEANLFGANLVGANLVEANLERANLERANLGGANLFEANLVGANLGLSQRALLNLSADQIAAIQWADDSDPDAEI